MRHAYLLLLLCLSAACASTRASESKVPVVLAIHGGAGTIARDAMTPGEKAAYKAALTYALRAGHAVLVDGGSALDAVTAALRPMEESPLFNAGVGAVFTAEGRCELDASIMDGATGMAGAVAGVTTVSSPILAARAVMEHSEHVLLTGRGAEEFAASQGLTPVPNEHFQTERRREQLKQLILDQKHGTVGCVALDANGHLAAGTSTGGMTNKRFGRVGDSPILGAGVWAEDATCAISSTGWGEYFLRGAVAHDVASRMRYLGENVMEAADAVVLQKLTAAGGTGGIIALDAEGNIAMPFNTEGMYRGWIDEDGKVTLSIWRSAD
ncbi:MAG: isoaspartyl peptidase/L-asparaginase [Planctomycetota bacterium]